MGTTARVFKCVEGTMFTASSPHDKKPCVWLEDTETSEVVCAVKSGDTDYQRSVDALKVAAHATQVVPELLAACEQLESFIGAMFGRGADAVIPELVSLPLGVPCKLGDIMRETAAAIAKAKGVTPPPAAKE